jgi:anti-anti-sigma factor
VARQRHDDEFGVTRSERDGVVVLALAGELDVAGVERLAAAAADIPAGASVVVDLTELGFMDSSGLRMLINLDLRSRVEGWPLSITDPQPPVARLLRLSGFEDRVPIQRRGG